MKTERTVDVTSLATISGDTLTMHLTDGGLGDADHEANGVIVDPLVPVRIPTTNRPQSIAFFSTAPPAQRGRRTQLSATATSGLMVSLSIDASSTKKACTLSGSTVAFKKAGTCIVDAGQAGNSEYAAAPQVQQAITVTAAKASTATTVALSLPTIAYGSEQTEKVTVTTTAAGGGDHPHWQGHHQGRGEDNMQGDAS